MRLSWSFIVIAVSTLVIALNIAFGQVVLGKKDVELSSIEDKISGIRDTVRGRHSDPAHAIESFKNVLPTGAGMTSALEEIFEVARRNALKVPTGDYSPETIKDMEISRYTVSFPVEGSYSRIKRFIYDLESSRHYITVEEISLSSGKEGAIGLKIKLSAYFI